MHRDALFAVGLGHGVVFRLGQSDIDRFQHLDGIGVFGGSGQLGPRPVKQHGAQGRPLAVDAAGGP